MRSRTDARRNAIVDAAWAVFKEGGYERASMSEISARVGGSKATLYSYFKSKQELFAAAVADAMDEHTDQVFGSLEGEGDLKTMLTTFGRAYLTVRLQSEHVALYRIVVSEGERTGLGEMLFVDALEPKVRRMATALQARMDKGELLKADPHKAAQHLRSLLETDLFERRVAGVITEASNEDIHREVDDAVAAFLRAYHPSLQP